MKYVYCPQCGTEFSKDEQKRFEEKQDKISCLNCPFTFYNNPNPSVSAIIRNANNEYLLTERGIEPFKGDWDFPGGFINYGELPEEALYRELNEELGIKDSDIEKVKFVGVYNTDYVNEGREEEKILVLTLVYEVEIKDNTDFKANDDVTEFKFFNLQQLPKNIAFPEQRKFMSKYFGIDI